MKLSIYILFIIGALFCLTGMAQAEEAAVAPPAADADLSVAVDFLPVPEFLSAPGASASNPGTEGGCSASTTCPGSIQHGIPPYQLSCQGSYNCYDIPGEAVVCDGFGKECFP